MVRRLAQMGILPGMEITIVRTGPLGGPMELTTGSGQNLALRAQEIHALACEVIAFPLGSQVSQRGKVYRVRKHLGNRGYVDKMEAQGLGVGTHFEVLSSPPFRLRLLPEGPVVLRLGKGEAEKLLVEPS